MISRMGAGGGGLGGSAAKVPSTNFQAAVTSATLTHLAGGVWIIPAMKVVPFTLCIKV